MSDIAPISRPTPTTYSQNGRSVRPAAAEATPTRGDDVVQFSRTAQLLSKIQELPEVRQELIDRVRGEIADGNYDTPEKLDASLEALITDLES